MISDAEAIEQGACLRPDVCIVGAGAAGISLALSLSGQGLQVLLLESGRMHEDATTQAPCPVTHDSARPLTRSRHSANRLPMIAPGRRGRRTWSVP